ncbi:ABC transporter substrate-binding protein [Nitriliruptor alkaliphilus]|uniref:ABC transporter substrate-binding protein n=1 Tax=Nitriliruptor alkaliphilus TaxID=427918 RepID=UPI000696EFFB|nr:ABC transporter substrate-binding protein [Nitriliruptor alkaliphilus]
MQLQRLGAALVAASLVLTACGDGDDGGSSGEDPTPDQTQEDPDQPEAAEGQAVAAGSGPMIVQPGACGLGNGEEAAGEPIRLGGAATNIPGVDFTWVPKMAAIYFDCVNANGGIHGRPIEYSFEEGAPDPAVWQSIATKLVEQDEVLAIVGNTSLLECDVNTEYYASHGYRPIIAGVAPGCFLDDTWSAVNMGPYYSLLGATQAAVRAGAVDRLIAVSPDQPGMDFNNTAVESFAVLAGLEFESILEPVPIADPAAFAQRLVDAAGDGGGVIMNFTGPTVVPLLQAIRDQGLIDAVIWANSTPPNDPSVSQALLDCCGTDWNGKFLINAEFNVLDSGLPDNDKMLEIHAAAAPDFPVSSFAQMGYLVAKFTTEALLRMGPDAEYTVETVNQAIGALTDAESDMLCEPWYFSNDLGTGNVSNNTDRTVVPMDGAMVEFEGCFDIQATDENPLAQIRAAAG